MRKTLRKNLSGFTLIETMMAIFILGIGMAGFSLLFVNSWQSNKFVIETGVSAVQVNRASNEMIHNLRKVRQADNGDYPIEAGDDFDLTVYIDLDGDDITERVHYYLDSGNEQLMRGVTEPTGTQPVSYPNGDTTTTVIANFITNTNAEPLFYYYNENYPGDIVNNPLSTPVAIEDVRLVRVFLRMNIDPVRAPNNINVESFVNLRNLENYDE